MSVSAVRLLVATIALFAVGALPAGAAAAEVPDSLWVPSEAGPPQVTVDATGDIPSLHPVFVSRRCAPGIEFHTPSGGAFTECALYGEGGAILQATSGTLQIDGIDAPVSYEDGGSAHVVLLPDGSFAHYTCDGGFGCFVQIDPTAPKYRYDLSTLRFEWAFERPTGPRLSAAGTDLRLYLTSMAVSRTGRYLVAVAPQHILWIDRATGDVRQVAPTPEPGLGFPLDAPLAVSPSGRYVAVGANSWGNTLRVFDMDTCSPDPRPFESTCASVDLDDLFNESKRTFYPGKILRLAFGGESQLTFAAKTSFLPGGSDGEFRQFSMTAAGGEQPAESMAFLGDSFASGEGVQSLPLDSGGPWRPEEFIYRDGTDVYSDYGCETFQLEGLDYRYCDPINLCHVADQAWPDRLAALLGAVDFASFACSGARTYDVSHVAQYPDTAVATPGFPGSEPQFESLARLPAPRRIFVQIGGNDAGFSHILTECALPGDCSADPALRREFALRIRHSSYVVRDLLAALREDYDHQSQIYLVGYPQIVDTASDSSCGANVRLTSAERAFAGQLLAYLEEVGRSAAAGAGARFVSLADSIADHQLCDPTPWVNGLTAGNDLWGTINGLGIGNESYHPRREAHAAFTGAIAAALTPLEDGNPEPDASAAVPPVPEWGAGAGDVRNWAPTVDAAPGDPLMPRIHAEGLEPGSQVSGYFASEPVPFAAAEADQEGKLAFVPQSLSPLPPGLHTLHVLATAAGGEGLQARVPVLVPGEGGDLDGDGIPNAADGCPLLPAESAADQADVDRDGLSDGCDPSLLDGPPAYELLVAVAGSGTVTSSLGMISCPPFCGDEFQVGAEVTLTASPAPGSVFQGWRNCERGGVNGRQCTVTVEEAREVTARFVAARDLTLSKAEGSGPGTLSTRPGAAVCAAVCSQATAAYRLDGRTIEVLAKPARHYHFVGFITASGSAAACEGEAECSFAISEDSALEALFEEDSKFSLSLEKQGGGQGVVSSKPAGLRCVAACSAQTAEFYEAEQVEIAWKLARGASSIAFAGEAGDCPVFSVAPQGSCRLTMNSPRSLVMRFE